MTRLVNKGIESALGNRVEFTNLNTIAAVAQPFAVCAIPAVAAIFTSRAAPAVAAILTFYAAPTIAAALASRAGRAI